MSKPWSGLGLLGVLAVLLVPGRSGGQAPAGKVLAPVTPVEAPLSLTASDGTGLELTALSAQVVVEDPLAFTELHLAFRNPESRVREGRFRITLPSGAVISRFAMKIDGRWQEGEVVELQAARQAYEDFLHRRQDPALLETEAGNEFSARVFPIPPNATKELIVSYSQELTRASEPYRLPLKGLPALGSLSIRALVGKADGGKAASSLGGTRTNHEVIEVSKRAFKPDRDFEVPLQASSRLGLRHDNLVVARVRPLEASLPADKVRGLTVLFDTSASRALGFRDQVARLSALLAELRKDGDLPISVAAFDQTVESVYFGPASGFGAAAEKKLRDRRALGASDLSKALAWASGQKYPRVLVITDGVATAGETANDKLRERVKALGGKGVQRLDVLAVGGIRDDERLSRLVSAGLPSAGVALDGTLTPADNARRLNLATRSGLAVEVEGAAWVWPQRLDGVQSGDEVLVYADLPAGRPFSIKIGGRALGAGGALAGTPGPLLERAWVKARLSRLMAQRDSLGASDPDLGEALRKQVIELSVKHRVLSPFTALLVLETEQDYARFGIERRALADILTVGPGGVAVMHRKDFVAPPERTVIVRKGQMEIAEAPEGAVTGGAPAGAEARKDNARREEGQMGKRAAAPRPPAARPPVPESKVAEAPPPAARRPSVGKGDTLDGLLMEAPAAAPRPSPAPVASAPPPEPPASRQADAERSRVGSTSGAANAPARRRLADEVRNQGIIAPIRRESVSPYEGELDEVMTLLAKGQRQPALAKALGWYEKDPGHVLALVALGEAAEATGDWTLAGRAYGSLIDLFPGRADLRRFAGNRLERVRGAEAQALAVDTYRAAAEQRPDHPASHRLLAFALVKAGKPAEAFAALAAGVKRSYPGGRFAGVEHILREDLALVAAAWMRAEPGRAKEIGGRLEALGIAPENQPSLRFVLTWETDANDVDFHIRDGKGGHAFYSQKVLPSGGELYADVTTGYGPECFTIRGPASKRAYPYALQAHYYSRGPMGYGMGKLQIVEHDGRGNLRFEERPFVVMRDSAYVDMGTVAAPGAVIAKDK